MAGTPKERQLLVVIEATGGWDSVYSAIADGALVREIAAKFGVSRHWFTRVARSDPERAKLWDEAMKARGDAMAEEAVQIADDADEKSPGGVQKAKLRAELRQWLAAVDNARYRRAQGPQVSVTIGRLHIDALRWRELPPAQQQALPAEIVIEAEPGDTQPDNGTLHVASPSSCLKCGAPATIDTRDTDAPTCAAHRLNGDGEPDNAP